MPLHMCRLQEENEEPLPHNDAYQWNDRDRQTMRDEVRKYMKRDEKGRFVSEFPQKEEAKESFG